MIIWCNRSNSRHEHRHRDAVTRAAVSACAGEDIVGRGCGAYALGIRGVAHAAPATRGGTAVRIRGAPVQHRDITLFDARGGNRQVDHRYGRWWWHHHSHCDAVSRATTGTGAGKNIVGRPRGDHTLEPRGFAFTTPAARGRTVVRVRGVPAQAYFIAQVDVRG